MLNRVSSSTTLDSNKGENSRTQQPESLSKWDSETTKLGPFLTSFLLHSSILLVAFLLSPSRAPQPPGEEGARGVALVTSDELLDGTAADGADANEDDGSQSQSDPSQSNRTRTPQISSVLPSESDLTGLSGPPAASSADNTGNGLQGSGSSLSKMGGSKGTLGNRLGNQVSTKIFGAQGSGSTFVYVFDRSQSMKGAPLLAAKRELLSSLENLERTNQFQIIFYNQEPSVFSPRANRTPSLEFADRSTKRAASQFVENVTAEGGTQHLPALMQAIAMRPDVIFFLTDANEPVLTTDELSRIRRACGSCSIHTIEFGKGSRAKSESFLKRLAEQNSGTHTYVNVDRLRANSPP